MSKVETYYTPIGAVKFPKTTINGKESPFIFNPSGITEDDDCSWKFQLVIDPKEQKSQEIIKLLDEQHATIKGANFKPYKKDMKKNDDGTLEKTGLIAINFTSGYPPHLIDSLKKECSVNIGWGSKIRVQFTTKPVNNKGKIGLGRYVRVIQVIDLKTGSADISGFDTEESGFTQEAEKNVEKPWEEEEN